MSKPIVVVDKNDNPIGGATKQEVWEKGLIHRVVRLIVFNKAGQILLQHRTPTKVPFPDCWDTAAAGHVDVAEDYDKALEREIAEEIGFDDLDVKPLGKYYASETIDGRKMNRFNQCYTAITERTPTQLERDKIDGWQWFDLVDVQKMVADHPDQVTDGLRQVINQYYQVA